MERIANKKLQLREKKGPSNWTVRESDQKWILDDDSEISWIKEIGKGRSSRVHRVQYRGAVMACKQLDVGAHQQREQVKKFLQEHLSRFRHPNIIQLYHVYISDSTLALLMEYADKGTVRDELDRAIKAPSDLQSVLVPITDDSRVSCNKTVGQLPAWRKFEILNQVVLAMTAVHEKGVLHKDIKPTNVMVQVLATTQIEF